MLLLDPLQAGSAEDAADSLARSNEFFGLIPKLLSFFPFPCFIGYGLPAFFFPPRRVD